MRNISSVKMACAALALALGSVSGCRSKATPVKEPEKLVMEGVEESGKQAEKLDFTGYYSIEPLEVDLKIPSVPLPLAEKDLANRKDFFARVKMGDDARDRLMRNGFVVVENPFAPAGEQFSPVYEKLEDLEIPIYVTADTLLHMYHIQFDETLRRTEENFFYQDVWTISERLLEQSLDLYEQSEGEVKQAARLNAAYLSVALALLAPKPAQVCSPDSWECQDLGLKEKYFEPGAASTYAFTVPEPVQEDVEAELALIEAHAGFARSPVFEYAEDYSQYVPRGHYTRSAKLENYFRAVMWFGRMTMLLRKGLVNEDQARIQTMQAALLAGWFASDEELMQTWERVYAVTSFYVGLSDDLGPYEYMEALDRVFGQTFDPETLDGQDVGAMKAVLAEYRSPAIYGGTGGCTIAPPVSPEQADQCLAETMGFRLMGQRFIPDSYMFTNLVSPHAGLFTGESCTETFTCVMTDDGPWRGFPRGLDVMAILGSERASEVIHQMDDGSYSGYDGQVDALRAEFDAFPAEHWRQNLYWSWLAVLETLLEKYPPGYQSAMRTTAWQDRNLVSALASWAQLRHDTILYAKQSYTVMVTSAQPMPQDRPVVGYVEPVPRFYNRLLALTRMTTRGLDEMAVLDPVSKGRLESLERVLARLLQISVKELENRELTSDDHDFIKHFADQLSGVIADVDARGKRTTMVADVHTDGNSGQVLEEGVGYVRLMVVTYLVPDGRILVGAGPALSYHEFRHPMADRLTDEKFRQMLASDPPDPPEWDTSSVY